MLYLVWCASVLALAGVGLALLAVRSEHLVLLPWPKQGWFVLEQRGDAGRYRMIPYWWVPLAVARFAVLSARAALVAAGRWVSATALVRRVHPLGLKG